jgi:hypothetical protein
MKLIAATPLIKWDIHDRTSGSEEKGKGKETKGGS